MTVQNVHAMVAPSVSYANKK